VKADEGLLVEIVRKIVEAAQPDRIILFDSGAEGTMTQCGEIDLLVIEGRFQEGEESILVRQALIDLDIPVDLFVTTPDRLEEIRRVIGDSSYLGHKYGRVIYENKQERG